MRRFGKGIAILSVMSVLLVVRPAMVHAQGFSLGAFDQFGILINSGVANADVNTAPVNANIGVGNITGSLNLHNEQVNGVVDVYGGTSMISNGAITGTQPARLGGASPSGSAATINYNQSTTVGAAISAALNLSTTYGSYASAATGLANLGTLNGNNAVSATNGYKVSGTQSYVFQATTLSIGNGNTLTINGTSSQYVIIDVTGNGNGSNLNGALALTGGITPDQVLINFTGSGGNVQGAANGATLSGTFLIPYDTVQLNSLTINGHIFGGGSGTNFQFVSNAFISQPAIQSAVPEPVSLTILSVGVVGTLIARRRRRPVIRV